MENLQGLTGFLYAMGTVLGLLIILVIISTLISACHERIHSRLIAEKKVQRVRCEMEKAGDGEDRDASSQGSTSAEKHFIEMEIIFTNYGLWIRKPKDQTITTFLDTKKADLVWLFRNTIIPYTTMKLFRSVSSPKGKLETELTSDEKNGFTTAFGSVLPEEKPTFTILVTDVLPQEQIHKIKKLEEPVRLIVTVLGQNGQEDQSATQEFFQILCARKKQNTPKNEYYIDNGARHIYW
jgi:hypothetical protein